jgi:hypothetical protein
MIKTNKLVVLIKSNYGNYVVQKVLKIANINNKCSLINHILQNLNNLGDRKLIIKWKHIVDSVVDDCLKQNSFHSYCEVGYASNLNNNNV